MSKGKGIVKIGAIVIACLTLMLIALVSGLFANNSFSSASATAEYKRDKNSVITISTDKTSYVEVESLGDLNVLNENSLIQINQKIEMGDLNHDGFTDLNDIITFENVHFYINPSKNIDNIELKGATINFTNCVFTTLSDCEIRAIPINANTPTVFSGAEPAFNNSFINGFGNLKFDNCLFKNIYNSDKSFIELIGSDSKYCNVQFLNTNFEEVVSKANIFTFERSNVAFGTSDKLNGCTINNCYAEGNGAFVMVKGNELYSPDRYDYDNDGDGENDIKYNTLDMYALDVTNCSFRGNGFFAVDYYGVMSVYSGDVTNNTGYAKSNLTFGDIYHLFNNTTFNMYGGDIKNNKVNQCLISNSGISEINILSGEIKNNQYIIEDAVDYVYAQNASLFIGTTARVCGNITCCSTTFENRGYIQGNVKLINGYQRCNFTNIGNIIGELNASDSKCYNWGFLKGNLVLNKSYFKNDGSIIGNITNQNGEFYNNSLIKGDFVNFSGIFYNNKTVEGVITTHPDAETINYGIAKRLINILKDSDLEKTKMTYMVVAVIGGIFAIVVAFAFFVRHKNVRKAELNPAFDDLEMYRKLKEEVLNDKNKKSLK